MIDLRPLATQPRLLGVILKPLFPDPDRMGATRGRRDAIAWLFSILPEGTYGTQPHAQAFWDVVSGSSVCGAFNQGYGAVSLRPDGIINERTGKTAPWWRAKHGKYLLTPDGVARAERFRAMLLEYGFEG